MSQHFPDLRADHSPVEENQESFWPSFADIMMVVVMIFLISTAFLIVKNWGLTQELTQTIESEREATIQVKTTLEENLTLEERLSALESLLSVSQLERMKTEEEKQQVEKELKILTEQLTRSTDITTTLERRLENKAKEIQELIAKMDLLDIEFQQAKKEAENKEKSLSEKDKELASARSTILGLETASERRNKSLESAQTVANLSEEKLEELRKEYEQLKTKYNKLVKPARTTKGKYVVVLRYQRLNGGHKAELKTPSSSGFKEYSMENLDKILSQLKTEYGDTLYIRIIFPENSELSYKEAWGFTNEILNKYDYYYQGK